MMRILAVDLGSGKLKAVCADVEERGMQRNIVGEPVFEHYEPIGFARALESTEKGKIPRNVFELAAEKLKEVVKKGKDAGAQKVVVIATEALRRASNHEKVIKRLKKLSGVNVTIISQDEEARLGFLTAQKVSGVAADKLVCWDSGSASFQISWLNDGKLHRHCGKLGKIPAMAMLVRTIRNQQFTTDSCSSPVSATEFSMLVNFLRKSVGPASEELHQKLQTCTVVGIGTETSTFGLCATAVKQDSFAQHELWSAALSCLNLDQSALKERFEGTSGKRVVPPLALVYAIMQKLDVDQVRACKTIGSAVGILCTGSYWADDSIATEL